MTLWTPHVFKKMVSKSGNGAGLFLVLSAAALGQSQAAVAFHPTRAGLDSSLAPQHDVSKLPDTFAMPASVPGFEFARNELGEFTVFLKRDRAHPSEVATYSWPETKRWGDAITMDPFVVVERTKVEYIPPPHRNRVIEAIKSGNLWKRVGRVVTSEAITRIEADAGGYGRLTVRIGFSW